MGLIGGVARTAVIAGTATAVGNRVSRRQANRWSQKDQSAHAQPPPQYQPRYGQQQYPQPPPSTRNRSTRNRCHRSTPNQHLLPRPHPRPAAAPDMLEQLRQLGELRDQGILTEQEFTAQKARILATT